MDDLRARKIFFENYLKIEWTKEKYSLVYSWAGHKEWGGKVSSEPDYSVLPGIERSALVQRKWMRKPLLESGITEFGQRLNKKSNKWECWVVSGNGTVYSGESYSQDKAQCIANLKGLAAALTLKKN